ncbi:hypothetical protein [Parapedobacter sp.]
MMKIPEELLEERAGIIRAYQRFTLADASETMERQFAFFDANLSNCFPHVNRADYPDIFMQMQLNRRLSFHDIELMRFPELIRLSGWDVGWAAALRHEPAIVCTYHTGSYRLINVLLARAGVPFSLVVSGQALQHEQQELDRVYTDVMAQTGVALNMQLIDAEQPKALLQMARAIKSGRSLLVYVDGNTGTTAGGRDNRNLLGIDFGHRRLWVRVGLASLAHRLAIPIYPVRCQRAGTGMADNRGVLFEHLPAIVPAGLSAHRFAGEATDRLYQYLAASVENNPAQWEGWLTLHRNLVQLWSAEPITAMEPLDRWAVYRRKGFRFLLHKPTYMQYVLTRKQYHRLKLKLPGNT